MLTCREVAEKSSAMVDGELELRERVGLRFHLLMCANCRRFVRQFKSLVDSLGLRSEPGSQSASPEFVRQTMQTLDSARDSFTDRQDPDHE